MAALPHSSLARTAMSVAGFVTAWMVVSFAVGNTVMGEPNQEANAILGIVLGLGSAWFELSAFPRRGLRLAPIPAVALRTAFYVGAMAVGLAATFGLGAVQHGGGYVDAYISDAFWSFAAQPRHAAALGLVALASIVVNGGRQVRLVLGHDRLSALVLGRYRIPVQEERAFLFFDLNDSAGLAQRLGPARFHAFKNEFFADVAHPILASGGRIYQYVGDEVVVTWRVRDGRLARSPAEAFLLIDEAIRLRAGHYLDTYGEVPGYRAGLHVGEVVTAEVGQLKKDIVHTGNAVDVAARIEKLCHPLGARLLVSEAALALAPLPNSVEAVAVGEVGVRGRSVAVRLYHVRPVAAECSTAPETAHEGLVPSLAISTD